MKELDASVLLVDDDGDAVVSLVRALKATGMQAQVHAAASEKKAEEILREINPQVSVMDLSLNPKEGPESGFRLLQKTLEIDPECRVIVLTGHGNVEYGVRALNLGAASFLEKPADIQHLSALIRDGINQCELRRSYNRLDRGEAESVSSMIVGRCAAWKKLTDQVVYASKTNQAVLITGETGTGKGHCAAAIHKLSARSSREFVRYQPNFATSDLVNSDLFGHLKGSFTGANSDRKGLISEANGGTLFLDEIDELPTETQVSLLGVLQDRKFRPLGSNKEESVDIRLICAANQEISRSLESGKLRKDFFHRIAHFEIAMPPLRERIDDIEPLAAHILANLRVREGLQTRSLDFAAIAKLSDFDWPGNVRQLEAVVEGAAYRAQYEGKLRIDAEHIELRGRGVATKEARSFHEAVRSFKLELIKKKLAETDGNQVKAAAELGLDRSSMRRILFSQ